MGGVPSKSSSASSLEAQRIVANTSLKDRSARQKFAKLLKEKSRLSIGGLRGLSGRFSQSKVIPAESSNADLKSLGESSKAQFTSLAKTLSTKFGQSLRRIGEDQVENHRLVDRAHSHTREGEDDFPLKQPSANADFDEELILSKRKVLELVKWVLRLSSSPTKTTEILNIFDNVLEGGLTFHEFTLLYEEITTRVELKTFFMDSYPQFDSAGTGFLDRDSAFMLTDHILSQFAKIWCSTSEIVEIKKRLRFLLSADQRALHYSELFEIYDAMLVSMRLLHTTRQRLKEFDEDGNGFLDLSERKKLGEWIILSYQRSGITLTDVERTEIMNRLTEMEEVNCYDIVCTRELSTLFGTIKEHKRCFTSLNILTRLNRDGKMHSNRRFSLETFEDKHRGSDTLSIPPSSHEKFASLDYTNKGSLSKSGIFELLEWILVSRPNELQMFREEFEDEWFQDMMVTSYLANTEIMRVT